MGQDATSPYLERNINKLLCKKLVNETGWKDMTIHKVDIITICINDRKNIFGNVKESKCILSAYGLVVKNILGNIVKRYPYVEIDYYVIMPNHIHAIVIINPVKPGNGKTKSLSEIGGAFKTMSSKHIRLKGLKEFKWQRSFYDRIIRNETELFFIRKYIEQNPMSLEFAEQFPENLDM